MKKIFCVLIVFSLFILSGFTYKENMPENLYMMVINDFDEVEEDLQEKFLEIEAPLTFVTHKRENYSFSSTKKFIDALAVPRTYMSIVASGSPSEIRNSMYSALDCSQNYGAMVVIFDVKNSSAEDIYYAIVDSIDVLSKRGANFKLLSFDV